jgi:hypothetical protein
MEAYSMFFCDLYLADGELNTLCRLHLPLSRHAVFPGEFDPTDDPGIRKPV